MKTKIAILGACSAPPPNNEFDICRSPTPQDAQAWDNYLNTLENNQFQRVLFLPSIAIPWQNIYAYLAGGSGPTAPTLPCLQDEFEIDHGGAANLGIIEFKREDFYLLKQHLPRNYAEAGVYGQTVGPSVGQHGWWQSALWRGQLCRMRLRRWGGLPPEQRRLELNLLMQVLVLLLTLGLAVARLKGFDTLGWLIIILLYPLNRPFIRMVAAKQAEHTFACLAFCVLRPVAWLAGLLKKL